MLDKADPRAMLRNETVSPTAKVMTVGETFRLHRSIPIDTSVFLQPGCVIEGDLKTASSSSDDTLMSVSETISDLLCVVSVYESRRSSRARHGLTGFYFCG